MLFIKEQHILIRCCLSLPLSEITTVLTTVLLPSFAMLWQSNNIWDMFLKGSANGMLEFQHLFKNQLLQPLQSPESDSLQIVLQNSIFCTKKKKKSGQCWKTKGIIWDTLGYICTYILICQPHNSRLVIPASNKRHHCQNLFLSPRHSLDPTLCTHWAEEPWEQRCQGMLPLVLSVCCDHSSCHPTHLGCWEPVQYKPACRPSRGQLRYWSDSWH